MASRILIIDDDRLALRMYGDHLEAAGHMVETADSGEAGVTLLESAGFDIVVTDMILPGMDGLEVLSRARKTDPDIGVIVISALDVVDPAVRAIKAGAFDYLVKPFGADTLRLSVARCLEYRSILSENSDLKHHLALSQAGARLASETEQARLYHHAAEAITLHMGAALTLLVSHPDENPTVESAVGSGPWLDPASVSEIGALLRIDAGAILLDDHVPATLKGLGSATTLRVPTPGIAVSAVSFSGEYRRFGDKELRAGAFLVQHLGQALQNFDKLEAARHLAYVDDLTSLFNARYLHRVLDRYMNQTKAEEHPFAVLFLDLDRFKEINDENGHLVGSELLVEVADILRSCIRDMDTAVRYGGDEYVVVLPQSDQGSALKVAERIRRKLEEHVFMADKGKSIRITASVGVACYPEHTREKRRLIELADHAMYRGKRGNKNVVYMANPDSPLE